MDPNERAALEREQARLTDLIAEADAWVGRFERELQSLRGAAGELRAERNQARAKLAAGMVDFVHAQRSAVYQ